MRMGEAAVARGQFSKSADSDVLPLRHASENITFLHIEDAEMMTITCSFWLLQETLHRKAKQQATEIPYAL